MTREWRLILWGASAGMSVYAIALGLRTGDSLMCFMEGLLLGFAGYQLHIALGDKE